MKGSLEVMKHIAKKCDLVQADLKEKEEELEDLEAINQALIVKEQKSNEELVDARKELISVRSLPFQSSLPLYLPKHGCIRKKQDFVNHRNYLFICVLTGFNENFCSVTYQCEKNGRA